MAQRFVKGYTNNHLTFAMVDATDFATPESALSDIIKLRIYGKTKGATSLNFVSSGTGSLTNDIVHVGPSATGVYTIALAKADLSDASAAWYDQYTCIATASGAAQQVLVVDGGILESYLSNVASYLSNVQSNMSGLVSDAHSAAAQGNSRVLLVQSRLSDLNSVYTSDISDLKSAIAAITVTLSASDISDIASAVAASISSISASDISDIASAVRAILVSDLSDILSAAQQTNSRVLLNQSRISDIASALTLVQSDTSDIASRITGAVATKSQVASATYALFASDISDIKSGIAGVTASVSASDMSDIASRVDVLLASRLSDILSAAVQTNSRVLLIQSRTSDLASAVAAGVTLGASSLSDIRSAVTAATFTLSASDISDIASAVWATALANKVVSLSASDLSDLRSAISAGAAATVTASDISDIASAVWAHTIGARVDSRVLVIKSDTSDLKSALTAGVELGASSLSDIRSAITANALSASDMSDIASRVGVVLASDLSDIKSGVTQANSRLLVAQSQVSDVYSLLSDLHSDVGVMSGILSDVASAVLSAGIKKNSALSAFEFVLVDENDHVTPLTGATVTATRSIDGGAFGACTNAVSELSNGIYVINLSAADLNGTIITLRFTATGADDRLITIKTQP